MLKSVYMRNRNGTLCLIVPTPKYLKHRTEHLQQSLAAQKYWPPGLREPQVKLEIVYPEAFKSKTRSFIILRL